MFYTVSLKQILVKGVYGLGRLFPRNTLSLSCRTMLVVLGNLEQCLDFLSFDKTKCWKELDEVNVARSLLFLEERMPVRTSRTSAIQLSSQFASRHPSVWFKEELINKRGETVDDKIKKLDVELARYKEQIKKIRPGPAQEAVKARAMRVLKQKRMYEGQRDMLYNQTFNLDQVAFASEGIKDAQQTMSALKSANKELKGMMKTVKIQDIDNLQDEMMDLMDVSHEIQETLGRSYNVPDDIDEEDLMGELDALEADMGLEIEGDGVPAYLQPDKEPDLEAELNLPSAPSGQAAVPAGRAKNQAEDELGLPAVPSSIRG
ncbi:hypothetical protein U1Q18_014944 [Sarracenia purpurea var. burkii]